MGEGYRARDTRLDRAMAIKVLLMKVRESGALLPITAMINWTAKRGH
jgi:hypothetical protein